MAMDKATDESARIIIAQVLNKRPADDPGDGRHSGWVERARERLRSRMFSKATLASKESKRRKVLESMLTIAAVLGESM